MPHLDPEQLSLLALYEHWDDAEGRAHLRVCPECAADYAALRRTVDAVKTAPDTSSLSVPGPGVWAGIHRELGLSEALAQDPLAAAQPAAEEPVIQERQAERQRSVPPSGSAPISLGQRRLDQRGKAAWWQRTGTWMAAAAAAVLVAVGAVWALNRAPQPLAQAELEPLAQFSATGSAEVVEEPDGSRVLQVRLDKDEARGYQEVWLIAPDLSRLVSLGVMNADTGTFQVPAGLDLAQFPIVDVSDEPVDGNPAHSSISIARGTLNT